MSSTFESSFLFKKSKIKSRCVACSLLIFAIEICQKVTYNGHALAMAGQFITFCRNVSSVNEQKVEFFILLPNREFSARNRCPTTNKKLMKCTSARLSPMRLLAVVHLFRALLLRKMGVSKSRFDCNYFESHNAKMQVLILN